MDNKLKYQIDLSLKDLVSSSLAKVRKGFERLDTPFLLSKARGVQEVSLALGHNIMVWYVKTGFKWRLNSI